MKRSMNASLTKYLPDVAGTDVLTEYDSSDNLVRSYVTPSLDENISLYDGANTYYYMRDGLGSVRAVYDASEALQNSYEYESFGQALSVSENVTQPYRFTGRAWDGNSSLYFYRTRYYNPSLGVFTQKDKAWGEGVLESIWVRSRQRISKDMGGPHLLPLYAYAMNNPSSSTDPYGAGRGIRACAVYFLIKQKEKRFKEALACIMQCAKEVANPKDLVKCIAKCGVGPAKEIVCCSLLSPQGALDPCKESWKCDGLDRCKECCHFAGCLKFDFSRSAVKKGAWVRDCEGCCEAFCSDRGPNACDSRCNLMIPPP